VIHAPGPFDPPAGRLLAALAARGRGITDRRAPDGAGCTLVLSSGGGAVAAALKGLFDAWRPAPAARVLVLSRLGAHPDARAASLREMWSVEEAARASGLPLLVLRLAPLLGPRTPFRAALGRRPLPPGAERWLLQPVAEDDVLATLELALDGRATWQGWYELAGPEVWTLAELSTLARGPGVERGEWEPPLAELGEQRLAEAGPWCAHFGLQPAAPAAAVAVVAA
jgi:uncharacterized protein YbjT (DUF2867 family)